MIHDDGTMDVMHNGKVERRKFTVVLDHYGAKLPLIGRITKYEPDLAPDEQVCYFVGQEVPVIIDVKWPDPQHCQTLVPSYLREEF